MQQTRLPSRPVSVALLFGLLLVTPALTTGACSSSDSASGETVCEGGITVDGACVAKCDPAKCVADNVCVDNACALTCDSLVDCYGDGSQDCVGTTTDDGAGAMACLPNGKTGGFGFNCPFGTECGDPAAYNLHACPDGTACSPDDCGGLGGCTLDTKACGAKEGCKIGKCADGAACTVATCAPAECKVMECLAFAGEADPNSYCSSVDCKADADCPGGYYCGVIRDPHNICGTDKGSETPCIAPADFALNGGTYQEGPVSLVHNACLKRRECVACETDMDCSLNSGLKCATAGAEKVCARSCASDENCAPDYSCDTAQGTCVPRAGSCRGTGQFCEPCINDLDCKGGGPTMACIGLGLFQKACVDTAIPCNAASDCPASPGGSHGYCLDENVGVQPGDSNYHHCYAPLDGTSFGCW